MRRNVIKPIGNGVSEVQLNSQFATLICDEDVPTVEPFRWSYSTCNASRTGYAKGRVTHPRIASFMHRVILCFPLLIVDHINHDGLDNRRENLRLVNCRWNNLNRPKRRGSFTSQFVGVFRMGNKWAAQIKNNYHVYHLGTFSNEVDAAIAWDKAALRTRGKMAKLNFPI